MTKDLTNSQKYKKTRIIAIIILSGLVLAVLGMAIAVFVGFPRLVSSQRFKKYAEKEISAILRRNVSMKQLQWEWPNGLVLRSVAIEDDPIYSHDPIFIIKEARLALSFGDIWEQRIDLKLKVWGITANLIKGKNGRTNLDFLVASTRAREMDKSISKEKETGESSAYPLPLDISGEFDFHDIDILFRDPAKGTSYGIKKARLSLAIPSLSMGEAGLEANGVSFINGNKATRFSLSLSAKAGRTFSQFRQPADLDLNIKAKLAGLEVTASGNPFQKEVAANAVVDMGKILKFAKIIPQTKHLGIKGSGILSIDLSGKMKDKNRAVFDLNAHGRDFIAGGKYLNGKKLGPLNFKLSQQGAVDVNKMAVSLSRGSLSIQENTRLGWKVFLDLAKTGKPGIKAEIGPINIDFSEIYPLASQFLPPSLPMKLTDRPGEFSLKTEKILFSGSPVTRDSWIEIKNLNFQIPGIEFISRKNKIAMDDISMAVYELTSRINGTLPREAEIFASLGLKKLSVKGRKSYQIHKLDLPYIRAKARGISKDNIELASLRTRLNADKFMAIEISAKAGDLASSGFETRASMDVNLDRTIKKLFPGLCSKAGIKGDADISWEVKGRAPTKEEVKNLESFAVTSIKKSFPFIRNLDLGIKVKNGSLSLPGDGKEKIGLESIEASPLVHYHYNGNTGNGSLKGEINIGKAGPPELFIKGQTMRMTYSGFHRDLKSIAFDQDIKIMPLNLHSFFSASLYHGDLLLKGGKEKILCNLFAKAGCEVNAGLNLPELSWVSHYQKDLLLDGEFGAGLDFRLSPGKMIKGDCRLKVDIPKASLGKKILVRALKGDIDFSKQYSIESFDESRKRKMHPAKELLSARVIGMSMAGTAEGSRAGDENQNNGIIAGFNKENQLSFTSMDLNFPPLPLHVDHFTSEPSSNNGIPMIKKFQANILGGSVRGAAGITRQGKEFWMRIQLGFTGLDTSRLMGGKHKKNLGKDAEISGNLEVDLPLTMKVKTLLGKIKAKLNITKIGTRALERVLYSLDPHENNEAIVSQRKILSLGTPKWIRLVIRDGNLSLRGQVIVKSLAIDLPALDRLALSDLSLPGDLEDKLANVSIILDVLKAASSTAVTVSKDCGKINFLCHYK